MPVFKLKIYVFDYFTDFMAPYLVNQSFNGDEMLKIIFVCNEVLGMSVKLR